MNDGIAIYHEIIMVEMLHAQLVIQVSIMIFGLPLLALLNKRRVFSIQGNAKAETKNNKK
jgi:hypothetical protein